MKLGSYANKKERNEQGAAVQEDLQILFHEYRSGTVLHMQHWSEKFNYVKRRDGEFGEQYQSFDALGAAVSKQEYLDDAG